MEITELKARLNDRVEAVCDILLPAGKRNAKQYEVGSINGETGKSLKVCLSGDKKGVWSDFASGEGGDLIDLWKSARGQTMVEALDDISDYLGVTRNEPMAPKKQTFTLPDKPQCSAPKGAVLEYLTGRGLTEKSISAYKVGECGNNMFFPFIWGNDAALIKVREAIDGGKPKPTSSGCRPVLFGWQAIQDSDRIVTICEGEIDALSLYEYGYPALSVPFGGGTGAKQQWIEHEFHNLDRFETIFICMDTDEVGQAAASEIVERLGRHRCKIVQLPEKDANGCLAASCPKAEIDECFAHASHEDPDELVSASEFFDSVNEIFRPTDKAAEGYTVPWDDLRNKLRFRPHELTLWTGASGAGKSQVLSHAIVDMMHQDAKVCLASLEMVPHQSLKRMVKQLGNVDVPTEPFLRACMDWMAGKLWLYNFVGRASIDVLLDGFEYARKRYGIDTFVIDSFMRLGVGVDDYRAQDNAIFRLTDWAVSRPVHLHLVAHARKAGDSRDVPDTESVKGTSEIGANAFNIIGVWRDRDLEDKKAVARISGDLDLLGQIGDLAGVTLNVTKQRNGDFEGKRKVHFNNETYRYSSNKIDNRRYVDFYRDGEPNDTLG